MRALLAKSLAIALALSPFAARAQPEPEPAPGPRETAGSRSPYVVHWGLDLGLTAGALVVFGLPRLFESQLAPPWCGLDCDRGDVNPLDRAVIGNRSQTAQRVSDAGLIASCSLPLVLGAIDVLVSDPEDGWAGYGLDTVILAETYALTVAANNLLRLAVRRPRPLVYDPAWSDADRLTADAALSFPSGHTSSAFALATAYSYTFTRRHPESGWVVPVWLGTYALAGLTGVMRTEAGKHFWTDVIGGAVLGVGVGLLVPWLHLRPEPGDQDPAKQTGIAGVELSLAPLITEGGLGVALVLR